VNGRFAILLLSIAAATGTLGYAIWRHAPRDGGDSDVIQENIETDAAVPGTGAGIKAENEAEVRIEPEAEESDFIRYTFSSFGLSQGFVLNADGSFRIEDAIAEHQGRGSGCQEGSISRDDFSAIAAYVVSSEFFSANNDSSSDFFMCDSSYSLEANIGAEQHILGSVCTLHPTEEVARNDQIVSGIVEKVQSTLKASEPKDCPGVSSEGG
jgi:hypothetical protein